MTLPSWSEFEQVWAHMSVMQRTILVCLLAIDYYNSVTITVGVVRWIARRVRRVRTRAHCQTPPLA